MTALARITLGDTGTLRGTVNADLSGATAKLHVRAPDRSVFTLPAVVDDDGTWSAAYADQFEQQGPHDVEIEVTFSDTSVQTFRRSASGKLLTIYAGNQIA